MNSADRRELVSKRLTRLGIESTPHVVNKVYWKRRLLKFIDFNRDYYARILGTKDCYMDMNVYVNKMLNSDNMKESIADFILCYTDDDLFDSL